MAKIRKWTEEDIPVIAGIERQSFSAPWTEEMLFESFFCPSFSCLVYEEGGVVAGYVTYQQIADEIHIVNIAVRGDFKRQGIATRLIEQLERAEKRAQGITLEVRASNAPARNLYRRLGFVEAGVRKRFYGDEDGIVMWKYFE